MAFFKTHAEKVLPGDRTIAMCWNTKAQIVTANEAEVDCQKCLAALKFNREAEADWQKRRAELEKGGAQ